MPDTAEHPYNPVLVVPDQSGPKMPESQPSAHISKPHHNLVNGRSFRRVVLYHVIYEGLHEFDAARSLQEILADHISKVVDVGRKWITRLVRPVEFRDSLVSTSYRVFTRGSIIGIVFAREPEVYEVILDWTSGSSVMLCVSSKIKTAIIRLGVVHLRKQRSRVEHDVEVHAVSMSDVTIMHKLQTLEDLPEVLHCLADSLKRGIVVTA